MCAINAIYDLLRDGLCGRVLTAYSREDAQFRKGVIGRFFSGRGKTSTWIRTLRLKLSEFFENSAFLNCFSKMTTYFMGCSLRFYGTFFFFFGVYSAGIYLLKILLFPNSARSDASLVISVAIAVLSLLMMGSKSTLAELLQKGRITHAVLIDVFGVPEEKLDVPRVANGGKHVGAIIGGVALGSLTLFVSAFEIVSVILFAVIVAFIMSYPEVGVLIAVAFFPLFGLVPEQTHLMDLTIALTAIAYLGKLIRGKRILRFNLIDIMVVLFGLMILLGGAVAVGGKVSWTDARHVCLLLLIYFMIVNLIRTPVWLQRTVIAMIGAATVLSLGGIFQYLTGSASADHLDASMFPEILGRITATFQTPNMFAAYLVLLLPMCVAMLLTAPGKKHRAIATLAGLMMLLSLVLTWSRSAWIGFLVAMLVFLLIYSRKTFCWLLIGAMTVPIWCGLLPQTLLDRLFSIGNMTDASTYQRVHTWRGSVRLVLNHLLGGVGYGTESFREVYPKYSFRGLENVDSPNSLYLSLLVAFGVFGLLVFLLVMFVFSQHCLEYIGNPSENYSRTMVASGFAGVVGVLFMGLGTNVWYDELVFLSFFAVFALTCAYIRVGVLIRTRNQDVSGIDPGHAHVDLKFTE